MGQLVPRKPTPLAAPGDRVGFTLALDRILRENLPPDLNTLPVRVRLIAHASWACGWNVAETWHYNYWGVKLGGWHGDYYTADAPELDAQGHPVVIEDDKWRAFNSPAEAVADTVARLRGQPEAMAAALDPSAMADDDYVAARKKYGYFTDKLQHSSAAIVGRCRMVRRYLNAAQGGDADLVVIVVIGVAAAIVLALLLASA